MNTSTISRFLFAALLVGGLLAGTASASPLFSIGEGGDRTWQQAFNDGNLRILDPNAGDELTVAEQDFFNGQVGPGKFQLVGSTPTFDLNVDVLGEQHQSLLLQWDPWDMLGEADDLSIVGWEYVYGVDPDLTGTMVHFSLGPPPVPPIGPASTIWDTSFELIDINGNVRAWWQSMPLAGWQTVWIDPTNPLAQAPFGAFTDYVPNPPFAFDITQVVAIRLDAAGMTVAFPPPPPGSAGPLLWDWMPWDSLSVTPEPSSVMLLGIGLASLFGYGRRCRP